MEWFKRKTSIAGYEISNWIIVLGRNHHSLAHLSKFTLSRAGARSRPALRSHAAVSNRAMLPTIRRRAAEMSAGAVFDHEGGF